MGGAHAHRGERATDPPPDRLGPDEAPRARPPRPALRVPGLIAIGLVLAGVGVARAEFTVCNQTLDVANVAIGKEFGPDFRTEGWWTIAANQCVDVIKSPLTSRYVYVYATDVFQRPLLSGATQMCVRPRRFTIDGIDACWQRGLQAARFAEVDTQAVERWTVFLRDPAATDPH